MRAVVWKTGLDWSSKLVLMKMSMIKEEKNWRPGRFASSRINVEEEPSLASNQIYFSPSRNETENSRPRKNQASPHVGLPDHTGHVGCSGRWGGAWAEWVAHGTDGAAYKWFNIGRDAQAARVAWVERRSHKSQNNTTTSQFRWLARGFSLTRDNTNIYPLPIWEREPGVVEAKTVIYEGWIEWGRYLRSIKSAHLTSRRNLKTSPNARVFMFESGERMRIVTWWER